MPGASLIQPFDYQSEAIEALFKYWTENPGLYPLLVMATGAGKTIVAALIMMRLLQQYPGIKILFLAHRKELVSQSEDKLLQVWPDAPVGVYSAALNRRELARITIASRDTISPALAKISNFKPDLVIVDEAHNISPRDTTRYRKLITELERRNPNMNLTGLTATPFRPTHGTIYGPTELFAGVAYEIRISTLVNKGRLAPLISQPVSSDATIQTSGIKIVNGDFHQGQLAEAAQNLPMIDASVDEWIRLGVNTGRKHTMFFCINIAHAEAVQTALAMRGYHYPLVTGKTASATRTKHCEDFATGRVGGLINVGVFTEGSDFPIMDCLVCLRPINSLVLWMQVAGRLMRIHPDPAVINGLLLDFGGNIDRFGPIDMVSHPQKRTKKQEPRVKTCPSCELEINVFKRVCGCGHEFSPPPHIVCINCNTENPPSVDRCLSCGHLFAHHEKMASQEMIMGADRYRQFSLHSPVYCRGMVSKQSNNEYLQLAYPVSLAKEYTKNLFIGYQGAAGTRAIREWERITIPGTPIPESPRQACQLAAAGPIFRPVEHITIDWFDTYKAIKSVAYATEDAAA